jgi:hypothetical protein
MITRVPSAQVRAVDVKRLEELAGITATEQQAVDEALALVLDL